MKTSVATKAARDSHARYTRQPTSTARWVNRLGIISRLTPTTLTSSASEAISRCAPASSSRRSGVARIRRVNSTRSS